MRRGGGLLFWGEAGFERRLCGAVVAAVPRKRSGNRRCVSWLEGTGYGGAASFSFGEKPGSNGGSAGRELLPFLGNGPGTGGVSLGWREQAAAGRRASLSGRGRLGQKFPRGSGCCRSSETVREQAVCFLVEGDGLRRGGEPLFRGEAGSDTFPVATAIRCYRPLLAFPLLAACLPAACHHLIIRCCLHPRRFSPAAPAASHPAACVPAACVPAACYLRHRCLPPLSLSASPLPVAFPRLLSPAACRPLPPPLSASPLLPAVPPLLTSRTRCLPFPPPCAGRADRWAAAVPRVVGRGAMRRRREVLRNNLENRKILPIFVSVKYRGSGLSRPGFLFFIGLSFLWQKRLSI